MKCWHCGAHLLETSLRKISFRATCDRCNAALHCCQNCQYYKIGLPNNCAVPGTEAVSDRQTNNFCEEFSPCKIQPSFKSTEGKSRFEDLFK